MLQNHTIYQIKWLLGVLLVWLAVASMWLLDFVPPSSIFFPLGLLSLGFLFPAWIHSRLYKAQAAALGLLLLYVFSQLVFYQAQLFQMCIHLVIGLAVYRAMMPRMGRQDLQLILLSVILIVSAAVLSLAMVFAVQVVILTPLTLWYLFLIHLYDARTVNSPLENPWRYFTWKSLVSQLTAGASLKILFFVLVIFIFFAGGSGLLFISLPRVDLELGQSFLKVEGKGRTGFSEQISLSGVTDMVEDETIAFRIDPPRDYSSATLPYWRMIVFDQYRAGKFSTSASLKEKTFSRRTQTYPLESHFDEVPSVEENWVIWLEGNTSRFLPIGGDFASLRLEEKMPLYINEEAGYFHLERVSAQVTAYLIEDMDFSGVIPGTALDMNLRHLRTPMISETADAEQVMVLPYPATTLELLPDKDDRATLEKWVQEITLGRSLSATQFAQLAMRFLAERHGYSMRSNVRLAGRDPLIAWMLSESAGHCEYFAGAFTLLARTAGFPTRIVAGYRGASQSGYEDYLIVRNKQAHAWVEIFDERGQWLRIDPTPGNADEITEEEGTTAANRMVVESGFQAWIDSLRMAWYRNIVNFDAKSQKQIVENVKEESVNLFKEWKLRWKDFSERVKKKAAAVKENPEKIMKPILLSLSLLIIFVMMLRILPALLSRLLTKKSEVVRLREQASRYLLKLEKRKSTLDILNEEEKTRYRLLKEELEFIRFGNWENRLVAIRARLRDISAEVKVIGK